MLAEISSDVAESESYAEQKRKFYTEHKAEIARVATFLRAHEVPVMRASINTSSCDVSVTGTFTDLKASFSAFRKAGYEPSTRPEKVESSFSTYFKKADSELKFWLNYSSTICKRVKVGTEMKEMPIYETVCE